MKNVKSPLTISTLNQYELGNALRFAEFRKSIASGDATRFEAQFEEDRESGRLRLQITNLAEVIKEANRISRSRTLTCGHRGFDILHVASALIIKATHFLTFDENQKRLAIAEGLLVPKM